MRVRTQDGVFESIEDCAKYYGITAGAVRQALSRGTMTTVGTGNKRRPGTTGLARKEPFRMAGHEWPSMLQCSRELGIPYHKFTGLRPSRLKRLSPEGRLKRKWELVRLVEQALERRKKDE